MQSLKINAPAKINLYLEIIGDREDGFHELAMVMQSIALADEMEIGLSGNEAINVQCDRADVPNDKTNLAYRAAALMAHKFPQQYGKYGGVEIAIRKHIPVAAGLAGGSTDAAAVLVGIDLLWELGLTQSEIAEIGAELGSDIPFCIAGGTAIATGRGEKLSPLLGLDNIYIVLGKHQSQAVSTAWAYKTYRTVYGESYIRDRNSLAARAAAVHSGEMVKAILHRDVKEIASKLYNDLEKVVLPEYAAVVELKAAFAKAGAIGTIMSGSGPSVFAICESPQHAQLVKQQVRSQIPDPDLELFVTQMVSHGIQVVNN